MKFILWLLILITWSPLTVGTTLENNKPLPFLAIVDKGELNYEQGRFSYQPWHSNKLIGKVRVVQYLAARTSVQKMTASLIHSLSTAGFSAEHYQTTTILNTDDAMLGTGWLVNSTIKNNKKAFSRSQIIVDAQGLGAKFWQLPLQNAHILVLDQQGRIRYQHTGFLSEEQVRGVITQVKALLQLEAQIKVE